MTFEQKLKAAALEAALHPALRHAAKNPARTARNLVEFTAGVAGGLFDDAQKAKLYDAVYPCRRKRTGNTFSLCWNTPPDFANDKKDAARSAASFCCTYFYKAGFSPRSST